MCAHVRFAHQLMALRPFQAGPPAPRFGLLLTALRSLRLLPPWCWIRFLQQSQTISTINQ